MSARYAPLPDLNYVPTVERLMLGGGHLTKQAASTGAALTDAGARRFREILIDRYADLQKVYEDSLGVGVPKELARLVLPVGRYSRMRASANLRNWLGFLTLRLAPQAQWEIRQYAQAVHDLLVSIFPRTLGLFDEGREAPEKGTER
jgi:thymidylate synthase (FAD)